MCLTDIADYQNTKNSFARSAAARITDGLNLYFVSGVYVKRARRLKMYTHSDPNRDDSMEDLRRGNAESIRTRREV